MTGGMRCGDCRFYVGITDDLDEREQCRRHAPIVRKWLVDQQIDLLYDIADTLRTLAGNPSSEGDKPGHITQMACETHQERWPYVDENDWCGEFQPK